MIPKHKGEIRWYLATTACDARLEVRIPKELLRAAKRYAKKHRMPLSQVVKLSLATTLGE